MGFAACTRFSTRLIVYPVVKLLDVPLGLLLNYHELKLGDAISRLLLRGANKP